MSITHSKLNVKWPLDCSTFITILHFRVTVRSSTMGITHSKLNVKWPLDCSAFITILHFRVTVRFSTMSTTHSKLNVKWPLDCSAFITILHFRVTVRFSTMSITPTLNGVWNSPAYPAVKQYSLRNSADKSFIWTSLSFWCTWCITFYFLDAGLCL
jgi:hypothetical protein